MLKFWVIRAILCRGGKATRLSLDHKPTDPAERERIASQGGFVSENGRVMGHLAVARSIGDCDSTPYITHLAYINEVELQAGDEYLVLACDGLFDVLTDDEIAELLTTAPPDLASVMLRDYAYSLGSGDNISVLVAALE